MRTGSKFTKAGAEGDNHSTQQFRSGKDVQGAPPKLLLLGWVFANRAEPLIVRECSTAAASCCGRAQLG